MKQQMGQQSSSNSEALLFIRHSHSKVPDLSPEKASNIHTDAVSGQYRANSATYDDGAVRLIAQPANGNTYGVVSQWPG